MIFLTREKIKISETTIDKTGKTSITLKMTGNEQARVLFVCLAAKADGTKVNPMVVFKQPKQDVAALSQEFKHKAVIATSDNAWMHQFGSTPSFEHSHSTVHC